jgi:hypothetical protein
MTWNYRLVKKAQRYSIHEAYYDELGRVISLSMEPIFPTGDTIIELESHLKLMSEALQKEAIEFDSICEDEGSKSS